MNDLMSMNRIYLFRLALLLVTFALPLAAGGGDMCDDPDSIKGWDELRDMCADDPGKPYVEELWATRQRMCADLKAGRISQDKASQNFEAERERIYQQWRKALDESPTLGREAA